MPQRTAVVDNPKVAVTRLRVALGSGEAVHTHDFPIVVVRLTAGDVDLTVAIRAASCRQDQSVSA